MATIPYQQVAIPGTVPALAAASVGGDNVVPNNRGALMVRNGSAASINVTVAVPGNSRYGPANPDPVIAVAAGATTLIGPFPFDLADPIDGLVAITYSAVATVTVAAVQI
ncbi:hypothetical protein NPS01_25510 [Nocardioides psychrotolerans]|uniref:Uncharacterized protein n=1 Tax=Nocardioides psychrotolerans TaxID=1005945 RepID=A0A1I3LQG0_9ACTN|nr:hypothetical protein [Nocardioides psychrotolerans]GEP38888.1 hypothetical protein NPS01_25510 [Nocardioides psychrotolerans]SFI86932.1 hypothetical protein SAMN05216561_11456 [Nocardioides psychrotolerans]